MKKTSQHSEIKDAAADERLRRLQAHSFPATNKNAVAQVFPYTRVNCSTHKSTHLCSLVESTFVRGSPFLKAWLCSSDTRSVQAGSTGTTPREQVPLAVLQGASEAEGTATLFTYCF